MNVCSLVLEGDRIQVAPDEGLGASSFGDGVEC